jgi:ABC-type sugar transport system ATPase subunit
VQSLNLRENLFLPADGWALHANAERVAAREWIARLAIRTRGTEAGLDSLSGGNQQKVLLARALRHAPQVLLLDEPTAGVDVGAKIEIHDLIRRLADAGTAILLASSDLPELLVLCDRIVALRAGRAVGSVPIAEADEPHLAALITGANLQHLMPGGEEVGTH